MCRSHVDEIVPRKEFSDLALWMTVRDGSQRCGQPGVGIHGVQLAGLDQRRDDGPVFGPGIMSGEGGRAWGRIASLIETYKINSVEPFAYLKSTLEAIAAGHPKNRIDDLLPWNFKPSS